VTLAQIKQHPHYPFRDFGTNNLSFLMLELYWAELFREAVSDAGAVRVWTPRMPADRQDGNPMLSLIDRSRGPFRALRVIQRFNTEGLPELDLRNPVPVRFKEDAYVPFVPGLTYGGMDEDGSTPLEELVISSDVSEACEQRSRDLIRNWCADRVPVAAMQKQIDDYWAWVQSHLIAVE
jgi:hypothetical protein